jgi:diguanylate cyclase (GGDEF)-like protein
MGLWMLLASFVKDESNSVPLRIWGGSGLLFGIAYVLFAARGEISLVWSLIAGNFIFALGFVGFGYAIARLFKRPFPFAGTLTAVIICILALAVFEIVLEDSSWRIVILAGLTIYPWTVSCVECFRVWSEKRVPQALALTVFFVAMILVSFSRVLSGALTGSFGYEGLPSGPSYLIGTHILLTSPVLLTVGFFLLCAEKNREVIKRLAEIDDLTGIPNRRFVFAVAGNRMASAKRRTESFACVLFDLDNLKTVNDRFGHAEGDRVLQHVATRIDQLTREEDVFGRLGGDEFVVFLPYTTIDEARMLADRYRQALSDEGLQHDGEQIIVTASFGVASIRDSDTSPTDILKRADRAMYRAKALGGNRTESSELLESVQEEV